MYAGSKHLLDIEEILANGRNGSNNLKQRTEKKTVNNQKITKSMLESKQKNDYQGTVFEREGMKKYRNNFSTDRILDNYVFICPHFSSEFDSSIIDNVSFCYSKIHSTLVNPLNYPPTKYPKTFPQPNHQSLINSFFINTPIHHILLHQPSNTKTSLFLSNTKFKCGKIANIKYINFMANNHKLCPQCRSLLTSYYCKKCGYKPQKIKVVDTQQEFGRFSHANKIHTSHKRISAEITLTSQQRFIIYLREYQQLIKNTAKKVVQAKDISPEQCELFMKQVKVIWQCYIARRRQSGGDIVGMFKKYIQKAGGQYVEPSQQIDSLNSQQQNEERVREAIRQQLMQQQKNSKKKRGRPAQKNSDNAYSPISLFRSYYKTSVRPQLLRSIEERAGDSICMTECQKTFLAYLLALKDIGHEFVVKVSQKYMKMLIKLRKTANNKSYVNEKYYEDELKLRKEKKLNKKQDSILLIMLIDLLKCWAMSSHSLNDNITLRQLLDIFELQGNNSEIITKISSHFSKENTTPLININIPAINYQLIYAIMYLAGVRIGICMSVGEVLAICGRLTLQHFQNQNTPQGGMSAVLNQQSITPCKTRRCSHLLAFYLQLSFNSCIAQWSQKWCIKLDILPWLSLLQLLNTLLYTHIQTQNNHKQSIYQQMLSNGKLLKYHRYFQLQQDIASLSGIFIMLKLVTGISDYPYLINCTPNELSQHFNFTQPEFIAIKELIGNRQIAVVNVADNEDRVEKLSMYYSRPLSLLAVSKQINNVLKNDRQLGRKAVNKQGIRIRNTAHLNNIPTLQLINLFKSNRPTNNKYTHIFLKFQQAAHNAWMRSTFQHVKKLRAKRLKNPIIKTQQSLNENIIKQLGCIITKQDHPTSTQPTTTKQCLLDQPSCNYELMYEYSDNLLVSGHYQQQYFLQLLCFNLCRQSQLTSWLSRYESVLKHYQM